MLYHWLGEEAEAGALREHLAAKHKAKREWIAQRRAMACAQAVWFGVAMRSRERYGVASNAQEA